MHAYDLHPNNDELSIENGLSTDPSNPVSPKPPFVKPELTCHGAVVDLTAQFGGSITPNDDQD
jgi:hypothetical protein